MLLSEKSADGLDAMKIDERNCAPSVIYLSTLAVITKQSLEVCGKNESALLITDDNTIVQGNR